MGFTMRFLAFWMAAIFALPAFPQAAPEQAAPAPAGLSHEWDIRETISSFEKEIARLKPIIEQIDPRSWAEKGGSDTYVQQWNSLKSEIDAISTSMETLQHYPERLSVALDAFLRIQSTNSMLNSFAEGVERYQNAALAKMLRGIQNENSNGLQRLKQYMLDLAVATEAEFKVVDEEAQRCRSSIIRQPKGAAR
jgi:hypothetical protein